MNINSALIAGSLALAFHPTGTYAVPVPDELNSVRIRLPAFIQAPRSSALRHLTIAEQQDLVAALGRTGKNRRVLKRV